MEGNNIVNTTPAGKVDAQKWLRFSEVLTLSLGAGLLLSGIIFFFAYNWETIHRFVKMGIVAALLLSTFVAVVKVPMRDWVRNITIFSMCILVGAFLALFGQIYQTGADSSPAHQTFKVDEILAIALSCPFIHDIRLFSILIYCCRVLSAISIPFCLAITARISFS